MTPPHFLNDNSFLLFENDFGIYAKLSDITFLLFKNVKRTYAELGIFVFRVLFK